VWFLQESPDSSYEQWIAAFVPENAKEFLRCFAHFLFAPSRFCFLFFVSRLWMGENPEIVVLSQLKSRLVVFPLKRREWRRRPPLLLRVIGFPDHVERGRGSQREGRSPAHIPSARLRQQRLYMAFQTDSVNCQS
jgi:hypothetical protein